MNYFENNVILACANRAYKKMSDASQGISMKSLIEAIKDDLGVETSRIAVASVLKSNHWSQKKTIGDEQKNITYLPPSIEFLRAVNSVNLPTLILFLEKASAESIDGAVANVDKLIGASICIAHVLNGMELSDEMARDINAGFAD